MNLGEVFRDSARHFNGRIVIHNKDESVTHDAMADQIYRLTAVLRKRGVGRGDHVILAMNNSIDWLVSLFAILGTGAVVVPVNPGLRPREMCNIANHCTPSLAIIEAELEGHFSDVATSFPRIVRGGDTNEWRRCIERAEPVAFVADVDAGDPALIFYTSGTTGVPKGVVRSHGAELAAATATADHIGIGPSDKSLVMGSLAFVYPLVINTLSAMIGGASIVLLDRFNPQLAADAIERHCVTIMMGVPTMYAMLMDYTDQNPRDLSSVRCAFSGGASLTEALCVKAREKGLELLDFWGLTECTPATTFDPRRDRRRRPESCGQPMPGVAVKVVDEALNDVPAGEVGEVMLAGPMVMTEYYLNPVATREALIDGWIRSGDLGRVDEEGYLHLVGRKKDLIIRGGANIYPIDVEDVLYAHDDVSQCAVVGKPDPVFGETVIAYVVSKSGMLTAQDLVDHCGAHLADYKVPGDIIFMPELPKGPTGKILHFELRKMAEAR